MPQTGVNNPVDIFLVGMAGMFFLALAIIVFVVIYQRKLLKQQQLLSEAENQYQQSLLKATIESQEAERTRVGTELHDSIGVMLSAANLYLQHLQESLEESQQQSVEKTIHIINETVQAIRTVSADLKPAILEDLGLTEAVHDLCHAIEDTGELKVHFSHDYQQLLPKEHELMTYRIIQELLTNTIRHAEATAVSLTIASDSAQFRLSYEDDGKGLDHHKLPKKGLGLKNIESRIQAMNGELIYHEPANGGLSLSVLVANATLSNEEPVSKR